VESLAPDRKYLLMALKHTEQDDGVFYVRLGFLASDYKPDNFHVTDWPFSEFRGDNARDVFLNALDGERKRPTMRDMMRDIARPLIPAGVLALVEEAKGLGINLVPDPLNQGAIPAYDCCGGYRLVEGGEWEQRDLVTCLVAHMFDGEELHLASDVLGSGELPSNAENLLWRLPYTLTDEGEVNIWGLVAVKGERSLVDAFCEQVDTARQDPDFVPLFKHHEPARVVAVDDEHVHVEINGVGGAYLAFWSVRHFPGGVPEVGTHLVLNTEMGMEASLHPILTSVRDTAEDRGEHLQDCIQVANRLMPCLEEHGVDVTAKATKWGEVYLSTEGPWLRGPEAWIQRTFVFEVWGTDLGIKVMMDTEKSEFDPSVAETLSREHVSQEWFKAATLDELVVELPRLFAYMRDPDQIGFAESQ